MTSQEIWNKYGKEIKARTGAESLEDSQFNFRLPDGTILRAVINPGQAATLDIGVPGAAERGWAGTVQDRSTPVGAAIAKSFEGQNVVTPDLSAVNPNANYNYGGSPVNTVNTPQNPMVIPQTNLQPGQSGPEVKKLQDFLISQGYSIPAGATGYFGEQTKAALTNWQKATGVQAGADFGYWGPKSIAVASGGGMVNQQDQLASMMETLKGMQKQVGVSSEIGKTNPAQPYTDQQYNDAIASNPIIQEYIKKGNTVEDIAYATETGDISKLVNQFGQPFSLQEQQDALVQAEKDQSAFYKAQQEKDTADTQAALAEKQRLFQESLITSGEKFAEDKAILDQNAAAQGVLFSGSRAQKEQNLKTAYEREEASKRASLASGVGDIARSFQYTYGNDAAGGLSDLYKAGSNIYNPKVATGGVTSGGLSSIYSPGQYSFQGTKLAEKKSEAAKRAAGLLANRGNKLLATSYSNQL